MASELNALEAGRVVLEGRGTGLYEEALDAIRQLSAALQSAAKPTVTRSGQVLDWTKVAGLAGKHGVRYRTNRALEQFFAEAYAYRHDSIVRDAFDHGYAACWAEMFVQSGEKPVFDLTDDIVDRGWDICLAIGGITA